MLQYETARKLYEEMKENVRREGEFRVNDSVGFAEFE